MELCLRASKTLVVIGEGRVVGYYALATGAVAHAMATGRVRRNMPDPIPVMVIARLAADHAFQGTGLGSALLRDARLRTLAVAEAVGILAVLLHAKPSCGSPVPSTRCSSRKI